jgi:hypothetical protein
VKPKRDQPNSGMAKKSAASTTDSAVQAQAPARPANAPASTTEG